MHCISMLSATLFGTLLHHTPWVFLAAESGPFSSVQFTNMGRDFQGTLDYVLYTTNSLVPTATLELPEESDLKDMRHRAGLPNETWSSDHIALLAEFHYKHN